MKTKRECIVSNRQLLRFEATETLRQALDYSYRRMRDVARQAWERHFADQTDPSDSCVTVRCSGFLPNQGRRSTRRRFGQ
jgi:hypothetical protein